MPQRREKRGPVLDQEPGIVAHRVVRADQVDLAGLPQPLSLPLPVAGQGVADRLDRQFEHHDRDHAGTVEHGRRDERFRIAE